MPKSRVRRKAKVKRDLTRKENKARNKRIQELEGWYKDLEQVENQAIANLVDRAAVEEGELDASVSQPGEEDSH